MTEQNEQQLLRSPNTEPTSEVIAEGLGAANIAYKKFINGLKNRDIQIEWRYYNDGKAWLGKGLYKQIGVRGGQKEITAFWLSIWEEFFKVTIYIPEKYRANALSLSLDGEVRTMVENAKQMGKLKFFPLVFDLRIDDLFNALYTLIDFRKMLK
jgi:hypothetical protein